MIRRFHIRVEPVVAKRLAFRDKSKIAPLLVAVAIGISAMTRLGWLGLVEFKNDESWTLSIASSIARGQSHPLVGIGSSLGIPNAPFFVYLMALPEFFSRDPAFATAFIGFLGVAAVGLTFAFGRWLQNDVAGISAALFFAVSPWGIIYSRKIWEQDALPLFVCLAMFSLFVAIRGGRRHFIVPGLASLTLSIQLHPTALTLITPAAILIVGCLLADRRAPSRTLGWLGIGLVVSTVLEAPFVVWQFRNGWPLLEAARHVAGDLGRIDLTALRLAVGVAVGNGYPTLAFVDDSWGPSRWFELSLLVVGLVVIAVQAVATKKPDNRIVALALLAWLGFPIVAQIRHSVPVFPHYFIVLFPAPFLAMGIGTTTIWNASRWLPDAAGGMGKHPIVAAKILALVAVAIPTGLGVLSFGSYIGALGSGQSRDEFGVPLERQWTLIAQTTTGGSTAPVYLGAHDDLAPSLTYLSEERLRSFDDRVGLLLPPEGPGATVIATDLTTVGTALLERLNGRAPVEVFALNDRRKVAIYRLSGDSSSRIGNLRPLDVRFENGILLTDYRVQTDQARRSIVVAVRWQLDGPAPSKTPTVFTHIVDAEGRTVAQFDGTAYADLGWHQGEACLSEYVLPWPTTPGPFHVEIGLYDFPSLRRFLVTPVTAGSPIDVVNLDSSIGSL